jgi:hypothetical protein
MITIDNKGDNTLLKKSKVNMHVRFGSQLRRNADTSHHNYKTSDLTSLISDGFRGKDAMLLNDSIQTLKEDNINAEKPKTRLAM